MQDMNNPHNPNQHTQQLEVVTLDAHRVQVLRDAVRIADQSATNAIAQAPVITVTEVQTTPQTYINQNAETVSRQLVEAAFAPQVTEVVQAIEQQPVQVLPIQPRINEPNTFMIPDSDEAAA
jgi:hypothetical protein